jgi:hypothetical protein
MTLMQSLLLCLPQVLLALNGLQMLLNYEVVPPAEVHSILRVLTVQASSRGSIYCAWCESPLI